MTDSVVFRTPGLIDLRAFTVMGFNAKPKTTNPIGFFGTGLKYAVAVLLRLGGTMVVYIGKDKYTFYIKDVDFRGKSFQQVWLRSDRWKMRARNTELPFTTEYGKNWQPWMVYRELESNTRDENGTTYADTAPPELIEPRDDETTIVVVHPGVLEAFQKGGVFVDEDKHPVLTGDNAVKVRENGGQQLFYRGIRAKDVVKPTLYSYDFTNTHGLTEDRTFESEFWVRNNLGAFIATCDNEEVIQAVLTAPEENWEHGLEIPTYVKPSDAFRAVMHRRPRGMSHGATSYYVKHDNRPEVYTTSPWASAPRPWRIDGDVVVDAKGNELFREPSDYGGRWDLLAAELVQIGRVYQQAPAAPVEGEDDDDDEA